MQEVKQVKKTTRTRKTTKTTPPADKQVEIIEENTVGSKLKKTRLAKKIDMDKISDILCIRKCYLRALEESDYEIFPGRVYAIGFLKSYASYLGLNAEELAEEYDTEKNKEKLTINLPPITMEDEEKPAIALPQMKVYFIAGGIILALVLIWISILSFQTKNPIELYQPIQNIQETTPPLSEKPLETTPVVTEAPIYQIVANGEVWLQVLDGKKTVYDQIMKKGDKFEILNENASISTDNTGALDLYIAGKKVKTIGRKDEELTKYPFKKLK